MKRFILPILLGVFLFPTAIFSQNSSDSSDFQIWSDATVIVPLKKSNDEKGVVFDRLTVFFNGVLRFGDNVSRPVDERIGFGFNYRLNKHISFVPDALYRASQNIKGRDNFESRVRGAIVLENKWKYFSLNDRNQFEYRLQNSRPNALFYKNRIRINIPVIKNKKQLFTPFVSEEPFYNFRAHLIARNEFYAGINKKFNKNFSADFYYLLMTERIFPKRVNGIGISLAFKID